MIFLSFGVSFGILGYRGVKLHTSHDHKLENLAASQYTETVQPIPLRGNIYDRRGHELAVSVSTKSLAAHPHQISDPSKLAKQLSRILGINAATLRKKFKSKRKFVWIKRRLMPEQIEKIEKLDDIGLSLVKEARRYYPNRELASQLLGAAGYDGEGLGGLELYYDKYLRGPAEREVAYRDARGEIFELTDDPLKSNGVAHLHLTIDRNIQYAAETELAAAAHRLKVKRGALVAMDPQTGAILALASYPRFNPNTYQDYKLENWQNVALTYAFEPGSSFKAITAATALEEGVIDLDDRIFCENGRFAIGRTIIHDHEKYGHLNLPEIIKFSSNIGTVKLAQKVGKEKLFAMIRKFGIGQTTDIDFPGETNGSIRTPDKWYPVDVAAIAFGQGLTATAIQMASVYATIANRGKRMKPYLVQRITSSEAELIKETEPVSLGQVIRPETADTLVNLLEGVTHAGGTGTAAALTGYRVAGKTGTAQKYDASKKTYSKKDYYSSFVGFAPADQPRLVIYVGLDSPKGEIYGGQVAAPIFRNVMSAALYQMKVPPAQHTLPLAEATLEDALGKGHERVFGTNAPRASTRTQPTPRYADSPVVPDFNGLSVQQASSLGKGRGIHIDIDGTGIAYRQEPAPGHMLTPGEICRIFFRPAS